VSYRTLGQASAPVNWTSKTISTRSGQGIRCDRGSGGQHCAGARGEV